MRLREYNIKAILNLCKSFSYHTDVDGEDVTVNVTLYPDEMNDMAAILFLQREGDLFADNIMADYMAGDISAADIAATIKQMHVERWKHWLEMWKVNYNPIWNVDALETKTIETAYGKITTMEKDTSVETSYDSSVEMEYDSTNKTTYNSNETTEQLTDGKYDTTHGHVETITEPTSTNKVAAFDSAQFVNQSQSDATQHSNTNSGTDQIAISDGKKKTEHDGYDELAKDGKDTNTRSGKDTITNSGKDTDTLSGKDTVTETYRRSGNIGVQMTQQLLTAEDAFWSKYNFFDKWFEDIAEELTIPIYD